jgi:DNA-binding GntR family transcriptional regulator
LIKEHRAIGFLSTVLDQLSRATVRCRINNEAFSVANGLPDLAPRPAVTGSDHIYGELKRSIMMGEFEPGQKMRLGQLADAFHTSNMPVREALSRLAVAGALETAPRRSMTIPAADPVRLGNLLDLRRTLEGQALRQAVARASDELVEHLARIDAQMHAEARGASPSLQRYLALNHAFHFAVYEACGNPAMLDLIELLWLRYGPMLHLLRNTQMSFSGHRNHALIIRGFETRDAELGARGLDADLTEAAATIAEKLRQQPSKK